MKLNTNKEKNIALTQIASYFKENNISNIEQAIFAGIAVDCSRNYGNREVFIVTMELEMEIISNPNLKSGLMKLCRTRMKWHSNQEDKIYVGFIDDPQLNGNKCSFFVIKKFLDEIIELAQRI